MFREGEDGKLFFTGLPADKNVDVHLLETKGGNKIVATFWRHPLARLTLLYSHGNAADLGQMKELFLELRAHLKVNIMRYCGLVSIIFFSFLFYLGFLFCFVLFFVCLFSFLFFFIFIWVVWCGFYELVWIL